MFDILTCDDTERTQEMTFKLGGQTPDCESGIVGSPIFLVDLPSVHHGSVLMDRNRTTKTTMQIKFRLLFDLK